MALTITMPEVAKLNDQAHSPVVIQLHQDSAPYEQVVALQDTIDQHLADAGAVLLRGGNFGSPAQVEQLAACFMTQVLTNNTEHRPASTNGNVQRPVDYSESEFLLWHNENTFNQRFPGRAIFACEQPALSGGQTPIADARSVLSQLPADLVQEFVDKQVMYVRNYQADDFVGLGWKTIFQTENKAEVEAKCRDQALEFEWRGEQLTTRAIRPAVVIHPATQAPCWVTQAQHWHFSCLNEDLKENLAIMFDDEADYPRNCYFGNGDRISDQTMAQILQVYQANHQQFDWQQGDVMLVDNLLKAHARNPYQGARKILVCFGDPISFSQL
ncbi:TauD/TfdA family dioxygenase [Pseudoalteromonas rubra]|uniref:TauD/TfdA-like domain-containing protein n=1 Tax=Pseudoalteromonas rubra TaxID=43658 RepID=A0A0U2PBF1_9GAMM|nr:TauD/TfdA family dioxygenase [Pseudoalteromonas rubra]ALU44445.1 hypothetical protein AT705_16825 [Pseudoalteromonas rubra]